MNKVVVEDEHGSNINITQALVDLSELFEFDLIDYSDFKTCLEIIDWITVAYFFVEYVVRFICAPAKKRFFFQVSDNYKYF